MYCPVKNVAREGQQSAVETTARSKVVPRRPSAERTPDMTRIDSAVWSSVMITTMFGRAPAWPGSLEAPHPEAATATPSSSASAARVAPGLTGRLSACDRA